MLNATLYKLRVALIRLIFTYCSVYHGAFSFGSAEANGLFEVSTGVTVPTGSDLESSYNLGGQASLDGVGDPHLWERGAQSIWSERCGENAYHKKGSLTLVHLD